MAAYEHGGSSLAYVACLKQMCAKCRVSFYCSADCQHADWKRHKTVCAEVVRLKAELDATPAAKSAQGEENAGVVRRTSTASFKPLEDDDDLD